MLCLQADGLTLSVCCVRASSRHTLLLKSNRFHASAFLSHAQKLRAKAKPAEAGQELVTAESYADNDLTSCTNNGPLGRRKLLASLSLTGASVLTIQPIASTAAIVEEENAAKVFGAAGTLLA